MLLFVSPSALGSKQIGPVQRANETNHSLRHKDSFYAT